MLASYGADSIILEATHEPTNHPKLSSPSPKPQLKTKISLKEEKKKGFGLRGDTIITWATTTWPTAHHHMADCTFPTNNF